jgi:uncharacterized membrane protein YoaK (UPF0700 family)
LPALKIILAVKLVLLVAGAVLAIHFGPFADGDAAAAVLTGMVLVAAMAIQNAAHRIHLGSAPPSTLMTGTTTQIMIDIADMLRGPVAQTDGSGRLARMSTNILAFALGCAAAALFYAKFGVWCFLAPPILAVAALCVRAGMSDD